MLFHINLARINMTNLVHLTRTESVKVNYYTELSDNDMKLLESMSTNEKIKYIESFKLKVGSEELQQVLDSPSLYYFEDGESIDLLNNSKHR